MTRRLVSSAAAIRESGEGFVLDVSADEQETVTTFVARERLCCPFLDLVVVGVPERRIVELHINGPTGAKEFIRAELHLPG